MQSILIVEDDKRVADLLKAGLEENGYQVTAAYDGIMALRLFRANSFQLVVSDIVLPQITDSSCVAKSGKYTPESPY